MATISYVGKGKVYLQALDATTSVPTGALVDVGNVSKLTLSVSEDKLEMQDYTSAGGGIEASLSRIKAVTLDMTAFSFSQENLAVALRGTSAAVTTTPIVDEVVTTTAGLNMLAKVPSASTPIVVKSDDGLTTYVAGEDYVQTLAGFTLVTAANGGAITPTDDVEVSYTPATGNVLQGLVASSNSVRLIFEGLNEAKSGKAVVVDCYKVQFSPTKSLDLIGDKFAELQLGGTLLSDSNKITGSKFMTITQVS